MCRSTADGGRRCSGSSTHRTRALNTARKQVERARHRLNTAKASGDTATIADAKASVTDAEQHLADTHAAHPLPDTTRSEQGHDTSDDTTGPVQITQHAVVAGVQSTGDVSGVTVVVNGATTDTGTFQASDRIQSAIDRAQRQAERARRRAERATQSGGTPGVFGIQAGGTEHGNSVHID